MAQNVTKLSEKGGGEPEALDSATAQSLIARIERAQAGIDQIMEAAKDDCAPLRDEVKELKERAADELNVSRKALNAKLGERRDIRKALARRQKLDEKHLGQLDQLTFALEDKCQTPLKPVSPEADADEAKAA